MAFSSIVKGAKHKIQTLFHHRHPSNMPRNYGTRRTLIPEPSRKEHVLTTQEKDFPFYTRHLMRSLFSGKDHHERAPAHQETVPGHLMRFHPCCQGYPMVHHPVKRVSIDIQKASAIPLDPEALPGVQLQDIITVLLHRMKDAPNSAEKACEELYSFAQGYEDTGQSSPLTPYFQEIVQSLLTVIHREDVGESGLRTAAYETLNEVVRCSTNETAPMVLQLVPVIMMELHKTLEEQKLSFDERQKQNELQGLLCGCLQVIIQKLGSSNQTKYAFMQYTDQIMSLFLRIFACRSDTVHEEAMLAIGALAYSMGPDFVKYMPEFYKYLEIGLQNFEEYEVCAVTLGVVGDICRAMEDKVLPWCDGIMTQLLKDLSSNQLHRSVKPPIFSCFGDIALAIGENFEKYLMYAMPMLQSAAELSSYTSGDDDQIVDHTNILRNGILEAYSGIFKGFKNSPKTQLLVPYAPRIIGFLDLIYVENNMDDTLMKTAIGVHGDLTDTLGSNAGSLIQQSLSSIYFLSF